MLSRVKLKPPLQATYNHKICDVPNIMLRYIIKTVYIQIYGQLSRSNRKTQLRACSDAKAPWEKSDLSNFAPAGPLRFLRLAIY